MLGGSTSSCILYMTTMISIVNYDESTIIVQVIQTETNLIFFCVLVVLFKTFIVICFFFQKALLMQHFEKMTSMELKIMFSMKNSEVIDQLKR